MGFLYKLIAAAYIILLSTGHTQAGQEKRYWHQGKLTWEDFEMQPRDNRPIVFDYYFGYTKKTQKLNDTIVNRIMAIMYLVPGQSWVHPEYKTDPFLKYNQVVFDILEVHRRQLQQNLDQLHHLQDVEMVFQNIQQLATIEIKRFQNESNRGEKQLVVDTWGEKLALMLTNDYSQSVPPITRSRFGYGMNAGIGFGGFTGTIGRHFTLPVMFNYGFDLSWKKAFILLNGSLGGNKVREQYVITTTWDENQKTLFAFIDAAVGYEIYNDSRFRLIPYMGVGVLEFTKPKVQNEPVPPAIRDFNFTFGFISDYKIRRNLNLIPNPMIGMKEFNEISVRAKLYISHGNFYPNLNGYSINIGIGFNLYGKRIHIKNRDTI